MKRNTAVKMTKPKNKLFRTLFEKDGLSPSSEQSLGVDKPLLLYILLLLFTGSLMVFSASRAYAETHFGDPNYFIRLQTVWALVGVLVMLLASRISPAVYKRYTSFGYAVTAVLLLLVLVLGFTAGGAQRWIGIGPFTFQPSELAKTMLILVLAKYFSSYKDKVLLYSEKGSAFLYGTVYPALFFLFYAILIMLQKHLSCIIILFALTVIMLFIGGSDLCRVTLVAAPAVAGIGAFAWFTEYTQRRILIWLNPELYPTDGGWQTLQGLMAIGSGGLFGLGFGNSRLKYSYVSEPQNDFIFTIVCEELGFVGAVLILTLFGLFVHRGFTVGLSNPDRFSRIVAIGITAKVALQVILNLAVITNLLPNTGISLPFFSYGGSSLVVLMGEMGILLSISKTSIYHR